MRDALRSLRALALEWSGINHLRRARLDGSCAAILNYHRVLSHAEAQRDCVEPGMYVTPETFSLHLSCLEDEFRVLPLHEIVERLLDSGSLPPLACALTFDDGWRDNLLHALPELLRRGMPAAIFVVSERVGTRGSFWADEVTVALGGWSLSEQQELRLALGAPLTGDPVYSIIEHLKDLPPADRERKLEQIRKAGSMPADAARTLLDWDELQTLAAQGFDVESHGLTHATLTTLPVPDVRRELEQSLRMLQSHGFARHRLLAYPAGRSNARVAGLAAQAGYRAAFTIERALASTSSSHLALPRLMLHDAMSRTRAQFFTRVPGSARKLAQVPEFFRERPYRDGGFAV